MSKKSIQVHDELRNLFSLDFQPQQRDFQGPKLWIKEFRFYASKSNDALKRRITLQPGVNILWADPSSTKTTRMGKDGGSGHSAGKTLFCRLIRYALGESTFAPDKDKEAIALRFESPFILVEVVIKGIHWIVKRPLFPSGGAHRAMQASFEQFSTLNDLKDWQAYRVFTSELDCLIQENLNELAIPSLNRKITWDDIRPWLTREQECRMMSHALWRKSHGTLIRQNEAIIRCALGVVSSKEEELQQLRSIAIKERNDCENLDLRYSYLIENELEKIHHLRQLIQEMKIKLDGGIDELLLNSLKEEINTLRTSYSLRNEELRIKTKDSFEREKAKLRGHLLRENSKRDSISITITEILRNIKLRRIDPNASVEDLSVPASPYICNTPILEAAGHCPCITQHDEFKGKLSAENLKEQMDKFCKRLYGDLERKEAERDAIDKEIASIQEAERQLEENYSLQLKKEYKAQYAANSPLTILENFQEALTNLLSLRKKSTTNKDRQDELKKAIEDYKKEIDRLVKLVRGRVLLLPELHKKIMTDTISEDIEYKVTISASQFDFEIKGHNSTATNVASIIAFDYASLIYGLTEENNAHPGFLMHDSPREADMSADIFNNLLKYLPSMVQDKYNSEEMPQFQYIVTTTTQPSDELKEMILQPILRADKAEDRLLGIDFS